MHPGRGGERAVVMDRENDLHVTSLIPGRSTMLPFGMT
jgi:hypothetical protein